MALRELIKVALKYDPATKANAIKSLKRVSTPGLRRYTGYKDMPRVINGLGIAIISTSKGVMTNKEAAARKSVVKFFVTYINWRIEYVKNRKITN
jgi:ribosomal protein S8